MTCADEDRHVLAATVPADAAAILTFNGRDVPDRSVDPFQVDRVDPGACPLD